MKNILAIGLLCIATAFAPKSSGPKIHLMGDSTMANKNSYDAPETGWGQVFHSFFVEDVEVINYAINGRSTKSFRDQGHWKKVLDNISKGDYVLIQFGHNDQKISDSLRYAAPQTDYRQNLQRYVDEAKAKGGIPVLITPVMRRKFDENGAIVDDHGDYPQVVKEVALKNQVSLIDLHAISQSIIKDHGVEGSKDLYMIFEGGLYPKFKEAREDNTHFTAYGAQVMAAAVAQDIFNQKIPLKDWLKKSPYPNTFTFQLPAIITPIFRKDTFDIRNFGARSDVKTVNTAAINQAIAAAAVNGGGTVLIPKGLWISGPITLKSNINLHIAEGALLQFSDNRSDYPIIETTWEGNVAYRCQAPISGKDLRNIAITGKGTLDGAGQVWKQVKKSKLTESQWKTLLNTGGVLNEKKDAWYPSETSKYGNENPTWLNKKTEGKTLADYEAYRDFLRPNMISLSNCKYVLLDGPTFLNSPAWTLHPLLCEHVTIKNVNVKNPWFGQNNDALDLESCKNGIVENCTFDTGDDAICIKSGKDEEGRLRGKATENFIIRNNTVFHGHGGFVIGSEMSGGVKNLFVTNCNFLGTDIGLRFKTKRDRGGVVENIFISDIQMNNIPGEAILFDMYYQAKDPVPLEGEENTLPEILAMPYNDGTPAFKDFYIENINCKGAETAIMLRGLPEQNIKNISIKNSTFSSNKGLVCIEAQNISLENVFLETKSKTVAQIQNSTDIRLSNISYSPTANLLVEINGARSKNISLSNTQTKGIQNVATFKSKASKKAFSLK
jgi:DNA sulfur modification protein DndE